jgi:hypothetical protein
MSQLNGYDLAHPDPFANWMRTAWTEQLWEITTDWCTTPWLERRAQRLRAAINADWLNRLRPRYLGPKYPK